MTMKDKVLISMLVVAMIALAGCGPKNKSTMKPLVQTITVEKVRPIPGQLLDCKRPDLSKYSADTLTDAQSAEILFKYDYELNNCYFDVQSIKRIQSAG